MSPGDGYDQKQPLRGGGGGGGGPGVAVTEAGLNSVTQRRDQCLMRIKGMARLQFGVCLVDRSLNYGLVTFT